MRTKTISLSDHILDAAARLFGGRPFHEVRMDDIATEAEVGKGTLYRYFQTKDDLYLKLLARAAEQYADRLRRIAAGAASARAGLAAVAAAVIQFFDERPGLLELIQRAEVERGRGPDFPWHGAREEVLRLLRGLFAEGLKRGEFTVADPELATLLLAGGLRTLLRHGKKPRPADLAQRVVDVLLREADPG